MSRNDYSRRDFIRTLGLGAAPLAASEDFYTPDTPGDLYADVIRELVDAIQKFIDKWNANAHPFRWTKSADAIIAKAAGKRINDTGH